MKDIINKFLKRLGDEIGLADLNLDQHNACTLRFDNKHILVVELPEDSEVVYLYTMLCLTPENNKLAFYERLLGANLFGKETGQNVFSCNSETREVFLTRSLCSDRITYDVFIDSLEELLKCIEYWRNQYDNGLLLGSGEPSSGDGETDQNLRLGSRFV